IANPTASVNTATGFMLGASSYNGASSGSTTNSSLTFTGTAALDNIAPTNGAPAPTVLVVYNTTTFNGPISGPGGLVVARPGNLILSGSNTYAGGTVLNSSGTGVVESQFATSATSIVTGINFTTSTPAFTRIDPIINLPGAAGFTPTAGFGNPPANPPGLP